MKKLLALILAGLITASVFTACGSSQSSSTGDAQTSQPCVFFGTGGAAL